MLLPEVKMKDFKKYLNAALGDIAENYQVTLEAGSAPERNFSVLINQLRKRTGKPVAILIDEYDAPLIKNIRTKISSTFNRFLLYFWLIHDILYKFLGNNIKTGVRTIQIKAR